MWFIIVVLNFCFDIFVILWVDWIIWYQWSNWEWDEMFTNIFKPQKLIKLIKPPTLSMLLVEKPQIIRLNFWDYY